MREYTFELWQGGVCVAIAGATHEEMARREIKHYAAQYSQYGPVEIRGPLIEEYEPQGTNPDASS